MRRKQRWRSRVALSMAFGLLCLGAISALQVRGEPQTLTLSTGRGIPYMVGLAMEQLVTKFGGVPLSAEVQKSERHVIEEVVSGNSAFGLVTLRVVKEAFPTPAERQHSGLRLIMGGHARTMAHLFVRTGLPIEAITDLKGRRVGLPPPATPGTRLAESLLHAGGLSLIDIKPIFMAASEMVRAVEIGFVDAVVMVVPIPSPVVPSPHPTNMAASGKVRLLTLPEALVRQLVTTLPEYSRDLIPAHTYAAQDTVVVSVAQKNALIAQAGVPQEIVYKVVQAILEHPVEFRQLCPLAMAYTPENVLPGTPLLPLHEGAKRYYEERGIL